MVPLLECFLFDLPVMALARGAIAETAGDAAYLFDTTDPEAVARMVSRLLSDERIRKTLKDAGKERLKRYDIDRWTFVLEVLLRKLLDEKNNDQ
jgi:glycosyltransferase involved in cell wall biosynthesis